MTATESFALRHNGPDKQQIDEMLQTVGCHSLDEFISKVVPPHIMLNDNHFNLPEALTEGEYLRMLRTLANDNIIHRNYIGLGYYNTIVPGIIQRKIFENPAWYTAYTPYQAEIAQGRLEALLNFQTMIADLTGLPLVNASLLDESTAAAEAMSMFFHTRTRDQQKAGANKFFVDYRCFPQTKAVLKTRSEPIGIELISGDAFSIVLDESFFGAIIQYPASDGQIADYSPIVNQWSAKNIRAVAAADLMSLVLIQPPGEWGAEAVVGSTQRFGIPMGYGGPHAGYFATLDKYKRDIPGRIIGVSVDTSGKPALRMALQTREQHIKREKATSNICTAQVLLAVMASMYAVFHGPEGLKSIAHTIHRRTRKLACYLSSEGLKLRHTHYFDTLTIEIPSSDHESIRKEALAHRMNFRYEQDAIMISLDEADIEFDVKDIASVFAKVLNKQPVEINDENPADHSLFLPRKSPFLTHPVFNSYQTETEMLRYIHSLETKDLSLVHSMIPLGSCTMKLNSTSEMLPLSWNHFGRMHPFQPEDQVLGYQKVISELEGLLATITGFSRVSFQPNSGAQGEYTGLMVIREYFKDKKESHRNVALIPSSAHGTNPASAIMAGMKIIIVKCDDQGNIDVNDLRQKAEANKDTLATLMITYPSTHGVYEESIKVITEIIHNCGGQVYMDGANMNAQVGLTHPAELGADVCHLNLHKTFAIPHGGGGPGMGPIAVAAHLAPFLPSHPIVKTGGEKGISAVSAAPFGSASILLISYGYIRMMGKQGLKQASALAMLNANYILSRLEKHYPVLYRGSKGLVAHELILDCRHFKQTAGVEAIDIAKRLMDYGYHAPTVAFPVAGTLMVEPTESESKEELDRFCDAMIAIRLEIAEVEKATWPQDNNPLVNSPHTAAELAADNWPYPYSRMVAVFPLDYVRNNKFWPAVKRVDNAYGDRNLVCTCLPIDAYQEKDAHPVN
ncbi:MAG: aminomethyl-transferring glycine dehydrogenase [Bacteroidia bacterium]|nr:aminomethyl-transferring glycine dehydrogenase [Bacteroidia bacterium]MCZ2277951.1 aminomethyl-transferring glycine dehydrogenase [Bacteroidia bacterium]